MIEAVEHTYYINLDFRTDRDHHILHNFIYRCKIPEHKFTRYSAYDSTQEPTVGLRSVGCALSHLGVWRDAISSGRKYVAVVEDDFVLTRSPDAIKEDLKTLFKCDPAFHVCNLGYNNITPLRESATAKDTLFNCDNIQTTSCYVINTDFAKKLIPIIENAVAKLQDGHHPNQYAIDQAWKVLQKNNHKWYVMRKCGKQLDGYSDIEARKVSYGV